ncbi:NB-ARC domain protein [Parafrankia sp. EUN1f]|nr:NB-ARC domain protein [Parafrankia sp. EUN1f]
MGIGDPPATPDTPAAVDVFVSYTAADEAWALWVAAVLEAEGRRVAIEAWDAPAGTNLIVWISQQMARAARTVAICSQAYFTFHWRTTQEWTGALASNTLIPLRVEECALPPVLASIAYRDLHHVDEPTARRRLLEALGLAAPTRVSSGFPGGAAPAPAAAAFPGQPPRGAAGIPARRIRVGMPPRVADHFQHRPAVDDLAHAVDGAGTAVACQVLAGMGGVGKTQLAAHHAHQMWQSGAVDVLVWVVAASREQIQTVYARAAADLTGTDPTDPTAAEALLGWLADTEKRWLIVLDDVADPADLRGLWPPDRPNGRVLVTTRRKDAALTGPGRHRVDVDLFTSEEASAYLTAILAVHERDDDPAQIDRLAADLGYLPLALSQAAAYLVDQDLDCATYRDLLADRAQPLADLAPDDSGLPDDQQATVAAAWSLSIDRADQLRPAGLARPMLELAAALEPNGVPEAVLTSPPALEYLTAHRTPGSPPDRDARPVDTRDARSALRALHRLSLLDHVSANPHQAVRIHQLIQRAVREQLPPDRQHTLARAAGDALLAAWPEVERDTDLAQALRANTTTLAAHSGDALWQPGLHPALFVAGNSLGNAGLVAAAVAFFEHLNTAADHHLGPDDPDTLIIRGNLAFWQRAGGDPAGASRAFEVLLDDYLRLLGPDHPDTLITRHNLALSRGEAGDPAGAVEAFEQLLTDRLRVLGPDHPSTLATRHNLAFWRGKAGDGAGAASAFEELLADYLRLLGPDHPDTLKTRHNLAFWRAEAEDPAVAASDFEKLLTDQLRVLGPDHPDALASRSYLADWQAVAGDPAGAAAETEALLTDRLRVLGPDHPDTLTTREHLAFWRGEAGDGAGAASSYRELLTEQLRLLGPDHPDTLTVRGRLAFWRGAAGDRAGAASAFEELLDDQLRLLGPDHPDTLTTWDQLAFWQREADPDAIADFEEVLTDRLRLLGPDHPDTLRSLSQLAALQGWAGDQAGAARAADDFEELLDSYLRVLGPDHPDTLATRDYLAYWREQAGGSRRNQAADGASGDLQQPQSPRGDHHPDPGQEHAGDREPDPPTS